MKSVKILDAYDVFIGRGLIAQAGERLSTLRPRGKAAVVTDRTVMALYGEKVKNSLQGAGFLPLFFAMEPGERHKNLRTLEAVLEWLGAEEITADDTLIALGGGVPGDVGGFAAAVYQRGIPFVQIPTTLLSAVDASVGGKTAVDLRAGKNLAGAFYQPQLVLCDTEIMESLPCPIAREGLAEILKYGMLGNEELFESVKCGRWKQDLENVIAICVSMKRDYVKADEKDQGERRFLNLGHTFGHAIETLSGYRISHGQAVGLGLLMATRAAGIDDTPVKEALLSCHLPMAIPFSPDALCHAALHDKKRRGDAITLVLPERIGKCRLENVPLRLLPSYFERGMGR